MTNDDRFIRVDAVQRLVGFKKTEIGDRVRAGTFPKPIKLSTRVAVWLESDIRAWMAEQVAAARAEEQQQEVAA